MRKENEKILAAVRSKTNHSSEYHTELNSIVCAMEAISYTGEVAGRLSDEYCGIAGSVVRFERGNIVSISGSVMQYMEFFVDDYSWELNVETKEMKIFH